MSLIIGKSFRTLRECTRKFSISCTQTGIEKFDFQGRVMNRLLSNKLERKIRDAGSKPAFKILDKKRIGALNKLFMVNITEVLAFGDFPDVIDKGIEITRVSVKDTSNVEVFWLADENEDPIEVQNLLSSISGKVASKLMYANMLGHVPTIKFTRDLSAINFEETKKLLDQIAYQNSLHEKNKANSEDTTCIIDQDFEDIEAPPPPMSTTVLSLPHDRIYRRIQEAKRKCHPIHIPTPPTTEEFQNSQQQSEFSKRAVEDKFKQKKALKQFIINYQKSALRSGARQQHERVRISNREEMLMYEDEDEEEDTFENNWKEDRP